MLLWHAGKLADFTWPFVAVGMDQGSELRPAVQEVLNECTQKEYQEWATAALRNGDVWAVNPRTGKQLIPVVFDRCAYQAVHVYTTSRCWRP